MKKSKKIRTDDLILDVLEYAFTEWLVRRDLFSSFKMNCDFVISPRKSFRDCLRDHIRRTLRNPRLGSTYLIATAFLFSSTPEGVVFWKKQSEAWARFCSNL